MIRFFTTKVLSYSAIKLFDHVVCLGMRGLRLAFSRRAKPVSALSVRIFEIMNGAFSIRLFRKEQADSTVFEARIFMWHPSGRPVDTVEKIFSVCRFLSPMKTKNLSDGFQENFTVQSQGPLINIF